MTLFLVVLLWAASVLANEELKQHLPLSRHSKGLSLSIQAHMQLQIDYNEGLDTNDDDNLGNIIRENESNILMFKKLKSIFENPTDTDDQDTEILGLLSGCSSDSMMTYFKCLEKCNDQSCCSQELDNFLLSCSSGIEQTCSDQLQPPPTTIQPCSSFQCGDGQCIAEGDASWECDGIPDCYDGSDESNCPTTVQPCSSLQCADGQCIVEGDASWKCDGIPDCYDGSDESNCPNPEQPCDGFRCMNGSCIDASWECDGIIDCGDKSDENYCWCGPGEFSCGDGVTCIPGDLYCDGISDCFDNSDEINCPQECRNDQFQCNSGECIESYKQCNNIVDCLGGEDETQCLLGLPSTTTQPSTSPTTTAKWMSFDKAFRKDQCPEITRGFQVVSLEECKMKCKGTDSCNAINYLVASTGDWCLLLACQLPIPDPTISNDAIKGYALVKGLPSTTTQPPTPSTTTAKWMSFDKALMDDQCPQISTGIQVLSLEECKMKCIDTDSCNAINYLVMSTGNWCFLLACPLPIPETSISYDQIKGYALVKAKWMSFEKAFMDDQCPQISTSVQIVSLEECKMKCIYTDSCNAINTLKRSTGNWCFLLACPLPIPEPSISYDEIKGYALFKGPQPIVPPTSSPLLITQPPASTKTQTPLTTKLTAQTTTKLSQPPTTTQLLAPTTTKLPPLTKLPAPTTSQLPPPTTKLPAPTPTKLPPTTKLPAPTTAQLPQPSPTTKLLAPTVTKLPQPTPTTKLLQPPPTTKLPAPTTAQRQTPPTTTRLQPIATPTSSPSLITQPPASTKTQTPLTTKLKAPSTTKKTQPPPTTKLPTPMTTKLQQPPPTTKLLSLMTTKLPQPPSTTKLPATTTTTLQQPPASTKLPASMTTKLPQPPPTTKRTASPKKRPQTPPTTTTTDKGSCEDQFPLCKRLKSECATNPDMIEWCPKTCGLCQKAKWKSFDKAFSFGQCPMINNDDLGGSLEKCKMKCIDTDSCNAINYIVSANGDYCFLYACQLPIPDPTVNYSGWKGYALGTEE